MKFRTSLLIITVLLSCVNFINAQLVTNTNVTANDLADNIGGPGVIINNVTINCSNGAYGTFNASASNVGIDNGVLLSTGLVEVPVNSCVYSLNLYDTGNDGWTCGYVEMYLDGVLSGTFTENSQWGSTSVNLIVGDAQTMELVYVSAGGGGCDEAEHGLELNDVDWNEILDIGGYDANWNIAGGPIPPGSIFTTTINCTSTMGGGTTMFGAAGPNNSDLANWAWNTVISDPDLISIDPEAINDACILEFDIIPSCDTMQMTYVFASEEYPNFVNSYNDAFGFFLSGPNPAGGNYTAENIAIIPGTGTPVSINNVNNGTSNTGPCTNCAYYVDNGMGDGCWEASPPAYCDDSTIIRYNGFTTPLVAKAPVVACETYHMKIAVADAVDWALDSGVFLTFHGLTCPDGSSINPVINNGSGIEGCLNSTIDLFLEGDPTNGMTVNITTLGTATSGVDYQPISSTVNFAPFDTQETISVISLTDGIAEGTESVIIVLAYELCGGQTTTDTLEVTITDAPELNFTIVPEGCGACDGEATVEMAAGGTAPYTYSWDAAAQNQTTPTVQNLCSGMYSVTVTDANGCSSTDSTSMSSDGISFTVNLTPETCMGTNTGTIEVTPAVGGAYEYYLDNILMPNGTFTDLAPGTYTISVSDPALGCQTDSTVEILAGVCCLELDLTLVDAMCFEQCNGIGTVQAVNATGVVIYDWLDNLGVSLGQTSDTYNGLCASQYTVSVSDDNCSVDSTFIINQPLQLQVDAGNDTIICIGGTVTMGATVTNGTFPVNYDWSTSETSQSILQTPVITTEYWISVTDDNGCISNTDTVQVTHFDPLMVTASSDVTICENEQTQISVQVTGGMPGGYLYQWNDEAGAAIGNTEDILVGPTSTTSYYIQVEDGCSMLLGNDTVIVNVEPSPVVTFNADVLNGCAPLEVVLYSGQQPQGTYTYNWVIEGASNVQTSETVDYTFLSAGAYDVSLTITSDNGCSGVLNETDFIEVYGYPNADFTFYPNPASILDPEVTFTNLSTGNIFNLWDFDTFGISAATDTTLMFPNSLPGTYPVCLTVTNEHFCTDTICKDVIINGFLTLYTPNAFTPDGNGINDVFSPIVEGYDESNYNFYVFNRWGELIYESESPLYGWNGTYQNTLSPEGVYVWKITTKDRWSPGTKDYIGHVTLMR